MSDLPKVGAYIMTTALDHDTDRVGMALRTLTDDELWELHESISQLYTTTRNALDQRKSI